MWITGKDHREVEEGFSKKLKTGRVPGWLSRACEFYLGVVSLSLVLGVEPQKVKTGEGLTKSGSQHSVNGMCKGPEVERISGGVRKGRKVELRPEAEQVIKALGGSGDKVMYSLCDSELHGGFQTEGDVAQPMILITPTGCCGELIAGVLRGDCGTVVAVPSPDMWARSTALAMREKGVCL